MGCIVKRGGADLPAVGKDASKQEAIANNTQQVDVAKSLGLDRPSDEAARSMKSASDNMQTLNNEHSRRQEINKLAAQLGLDDDDIQGTASRGATFPLSANVPDSHRESRATSGAKEQVRDIQTNNTQGATSAGRDLISKVSESQRESRTPSDGREKVRDVHANNTQGATSAGHNLTSKHSESHRESRTPSDARERIRQVMVEMYKSSATTPDVGEVETIGDPVPRAQPDLDMRNGSSSKVRNANAGKDRAPSQASHIVRDTVKDANDDILCNAECAKVPVSKNSEQDSRDKRLAEVGNIGSASAVKGRQVEVILAGGAAFRRDKLDQATKSTSAPKPQAEESISRDNSSNHNSAAVEPKTGNGYRPGNIQVEVILAKGMRNNDTQVTRASSAAEINMPDMVRSESTSFAQTHRTTRREQRPNLASVSVPDVDVENIMVDVFDMHQDLQLELDLQEMIEKGTPLFVRKQFYQQQCLRWHPDKNPNDQERAKHMFQILQDRKAWFLS